MTPIQYRPRPEGVGNFDDLTAIKNCWEFSYEKITKINSLLSAKINNPNVSVVVAGSYARMEASQESDLDFFILSNEVGEGISDVYNTVITTVKDLGIKLPNPDGVFNLTLKLNDLIQNIGSDLDNLKPLAQRLLLLMESQPVYNADFYNQTINEVLIKYLEYAIEDPSREAVFLLNDTIRYFRSICVNYQYTCWKEEEKWTLRNVKLRHSRVIMYAGLLLLIINASKNRQDKLSYIRKYVGYTPIERIVHVYQDNDDSNIEVILKLYNLFLDRISTKDIRESLRGLDYKERYTNPSYKELKDNSDSLQTELTRLILENKENWNSKIFEYLIF